MHPARWKNRVVEFHSELKKLKGAIEILPGSGYLLPVPEHSTRYDGPHDII